MANLSMPIVSVFMTTYYHEKYVAKAIESILMQKVDFPIQIVISDDASQDNTPNILLEYAQKYPFIKVNINKENIGLSANMLLAKSLCEGKYITDLSGDDYWIDEYKLKKQVEFLEKNEDYLVVCNRLQSLADDTERIIDELPKKSLCNRPFTLKMFLKGKDLPLNGFMMRNPFINKEGTEYYSLMPKMSKYIDDLTDCILMLRRGKAWIVDESYVAYRVRVETKDDKNFNSQNKGLNSFRKHVELLNNLENHFGKELNLFTRYKIATYPAISIMRRLKDKTEFWEIYKSIPKRYRNKALFIRSFMCLAINKIKNLIGLK